MDKGHLHCMRRDSCSSVFCMCSRFVTVPPYYLGPHLKVDGAVEATSCKNHKRVPSLKEGLIAEHTSLKIHDRL